MTFERRPARYFDGQSLLSSSKASLTAREEEVLVTVARGHIDNEIAGEPYKTPSTVKAHASG